MCVCCICQDSALLSGVACATCKFFVCLSMRVWVLFSPWFFLVPEPISEPARPPFGSFLGSAMLAGEQRGIEGIVRCLVGDRGTAGRYPSFRVNAKTASRPADSHHGHQNGNIGMPEHPAPTCPHQDWCLLIYTKLPTP